eukprot:scaffold18962_cov27-Tisochrysis_lutea.AAC.1
MRGRRPCRGLHRKGTTFKIRLFPFGRKASRGARGLRRRRGISPREARERAKGGPRLDNETLQNIPIFRRTRTWSCISFQSVRATHT